MSRVAIISDIHGNITALEKVLEDIEKRKVDKIICLGDLVIKSSNSDLTVDLIREKCDVILKGNCDEVVSNNCNTEEHYWNRKKIGEERCNFLRSLPVATQLYMSGHLIRMFHSSPYGLERKFNIGYSSTNDITYSQMFDNTEFIKDIHKNLVPDIIIYGHTHSANMVRYGNKQIVNCGSVGVAVELINENPEDIKNRLTTVSTYLIVEGEYNSQELSDINFNFIRLPYDINTEIEYLKNSDMPNKDEAIFALETGIYIKR